MSNMTIEHERLRLLALNSYEALSAPSNRKLDELTALAASICQTPIALVTLIDSDRQWFKSSYGLAGTHTPREHAFCNHTIQTPQTLIIQDAKLDERFAENPFVTGEPNVRFYAGAPLVTPEGHRLGSLCVVDHSPRSLSVSQLNALRVLANQVMTELELHRSNRLLKNFIRGNEIIGESIGQIFNPIAMIKLKIANLVNSPTIRERWNSQDLYKLVAIEAKIHSVEGILHQMNSLAGEETQIELEPKVKLIS